MKTIYKYQLKLEESQTLNLTKSYQILSVQLQSSALCLWAIVDPQMDLEKVEILVVGTGRPLPDGQLDYLATVQHGMFVWHIFLKL